MGCRNWSILSHLAEPPNLSLECILSRCSFLHEKMEFLSQVSTNILEKYRQPTRRFYVQRKSWYVPPVIVLSAPCGWEKEAVFQDEVWVRGVLVLMWQIFQVLSTHCVVSDFWSQPTPLYVFRDQVVPIKCFLLTSVNNPWRWSTSSGLIFLTFTFDFRWRC